MARPREHPSAAPLARLSARALGATFERALEARDGVQGAHAIHELWLRGEISLNVERMIARLWERASATVPEWLPMRYVDRLPEIYETAAQFHAGAKGRSNIYLVLLDYRDSRADPYGLYVGMTGYPPAQRFDQHKAGIRAAGSVLKRGLELLVGPTMHLQRIARRDAARIEEAFAEALRARGFFVQGGH
ncbi:MAG TPA: hypothetical protein VMU86_03170 [Steroidobacteraceae bacterium]|nr:hypothetical protein [Steroidobacteraceae bacterium]